MALIALDNPLFVFPENVVWADQHNWSPVAGTMTILLTGRPLFQTSSLTAGRPITLQSQQRGNGWSGLYTIAEVEALKLIRDGEDQQRTLTIGSSSFTVRFDRSAGGFSVEDPAPVAAGEAMWPGRIYPVTVRFLTTS